MIIQKPIETDFMGVLNLKSTVETNLDLCIGCKACVDQCPVENAIIVSQNESGRTIVQTNSDYCGGCGRCIGVCTEKARHYA